MNQMAVHLLLRLHVRFVLTFDMRTVLVTRIFVLVFGRNVLRRYRLL